MSYQAMKQHGEKLKVLSDRKESEKATYGVTSIV